MAKRKPTHPDVPGFEPPHEGHEEPELEVPMSERHEESHAADLPTATAVEGLSTGMFNLMESLQLETVCPKCEGKKVLVNPAWAEWRKRKEAGESSYPPIGAEDEPCPECHRRGGVPTPLGEKLLDFLRRYT